MSKQISVSDSIYQTLLDLKLCKSESFGSVIERLLDIIKKG
jgi:predicted CopG family antitoxin